MVDRFMGQIMDKKDYAAVLEIFEDETQLSGDSLNKLLEVYTKYLDDVEDPVYIRLFLAVDMMAFHGEDRSCLAPLELGEGAPDMLGRAVELTKAYLTMPVEQAEEIAARVRDEAVPVQARALFARIALDGMAGTLNFSEIQKPVREIAGFLSGLDGQTLENCAKLCKEVRLKCGQ